MGEHVYPYSYRDNPDVPKFPDDKPIIVFDGYCVLCSRWANFVIKRDTRKRFRMLTAQSELGEALYKHYDIKSGDYNTNILIEDGEIRVKADGTIAMISGLGLPWSMVKIARILPRALADWLYDKLARNRLKWFGQREQCYIPPPDARERFL